MLISASDRTIQDINALIQKKNFDVCKLLFIGVEWLRKGGELAVKVAVNSISAEFELSCMWLVATHPATARYVKRHGFVSKASEAGRRLLDELFSQAHFFILPTRADCTPVVFPEAGSYGLPVLTTGWRDSDLIRNGKNGQTFKLDESPEAYCDFIEKRMLSKQEYEQLALSSFREYSERLNWTSAGRQVSSLFRNFAADMFEKGIITGE